MTDAHYRAATRQIARDHVKWVNGDTTLRTGLIARPIEALARALIAEIDKKLLTELPRIERDSLSRTRHNLVGVVQLTC